MSGNHRERNAATDAGKRILAELCDTPIETGLFLELALGMTRALADLHAKNVVYNAISPHTVLVDQGSGEVWLAGFCPYLRETSFQLEPDPAYLSPEQTGRVNRPVDQRSDLYSLGITFYRMLTAALPFEAETLLEWVHCHLARAPRPPSDHNDRIPPILAQIVLKLLEKNVEERYQSAKGVEADLEQCRELWYSRGVIPSFELGKADLSDRLLLPQKLFGREEELLALTRAFERVAASGISEFVAVAGYSGVGKTSLVRELNLPAARRNAFFAAGKYDPLKRDAPYSTLADAVRQLLLPLLTQSEERVAVWREALLEALGESAQLMNDVIPELELVIGRQAPVGAAPPVENQNRFNLLFQRLIGVFARQEHPLVLFLDDLQWADPATLDLLERLILNRELNYLLLVGAYRDNEVGPLHPLSLLLERLERRGAHLGTILLSPLSPTAVTSYLRAALSLEPSARLTELARLIHEKTAGNPFYLTQFLSALYQQGLLFFSRREHRWSWDVHSIRRQSYTENVAEFMAAKLAKLSPAALKKVMVASCVGTTVDVPLLVSACGVSEEQTRESLGEAVREGFLVGANGRYSFLHDRVQEAAYLLVPEEERALQHLRIGRLLAAALPQDAPAERLFEAVDQLNRGLPHIASAEERAQLCRLNETAGQRAKDAVAFSAARSYFAHACALLPDDAWTSSQERAFSLHLALAECEHLSGCFERAEELFRHLLLQAASVRQRARVQQLRSKLYDTTGRYRDSLNMVLEALALFGVRLPESEQDLADAFSAAARDIAAQIGERPLGTLVEAEPCSDPDAAMVMSLLMDGLSPAYASAPPYFPLLSATAVQYALRYGMTPSSASAYNSYALVLIALLQDFRSALSFSEVALALAERSGDHRSRGWTLVGHAGLVLPWRRHFSECIPLLERGLQELLQAGDFAGASHCTVLAAWDLLELGEPLDGVLQKNQSYLRICRETQNEMTFLTLRLLEQFAACLKGKTAGALSLDDPAFNEADCSTRFAETAWYAGLAYYHVMKLISAFIYGYHREALEHAERAEPLLAMMRAMPVAGTLTFYRALALAALLRTSEGDPLPPGGEITLTRQEAADILRELEKRLERWGGGSPSFAARYALVAAESARNEGRDLDAERLYEEAVLSAKENGFLHVCAVACEAAADFHRARGMTRFADGYLREARNCYQRWGAEGKVAQLDRTYPWLSGEGPVPGFATLIGRVDAITLVESAQAISGEIELGRVLDSLMRIVLESAGAQRGYLLLARGNELSVEARAQLEGDQVAVTVGPAPQEALPASVLNYVRRTHREVSLDGAAADPTFGSDRYFQPHHPQSVLCLPVLRQGRLVGVLYLENDLSRGAFPPQRLALLQVLTGQAAGALENARIYQELKESEQRYRQLNETLEQRVAQAVEELEQKNRLLLIQSRQAVMGEIISSISHQWRQPLNMLGLLAQELQLMQTLGVGSEDRIEENVGQMMAILEKLSCTIDDFRFFCRPTTEKVLFSVREVIEKTLSLLGATFAAHGIETSLEAAADPQVSGYPGEFSQVILNILMNAKDAFLSGGTVEGRKVTIRLEERPNRARITIGDNAGGVPAEIIPKVFEPYFTTKGPAGTGIGLYMAKTIIEKNMNGVLEVRNVAGGAEFTVEV